MDFILAMELFSKMNHVDVALDEMFSFFGPMIEVKDYDACDDILNKTNPYKINNDISLGLLNYTLPYKDQLPGREVFLGKLKDKFEKENVPTDVLKNL